MLGIAQKLFVERKHKNPWKPTKPFFSSHQWPLLENLLEKGQMEYVDFALAELLLSHIEQPSQSVAAFICHLSLASREGHLCIQVSQALSPDVHALWSFEEENELSVALTSEILKGAGELPEELKTKVDTLTAYPATPICQFGDLYYLQKFWLLEKQCIAGMKRLLNDTPNIIIDIKKAEEKINELIDKQKLLKEQAEAILSGCSQNFTLIIGGPGTGKTYTAGLFLRIFWENLTEEQQKNCRIALAAPTGKAASNLQASILKGMEGMKNAPLITAQTLHALLGIFNSKKHPLECHLINEDLIIVDESSMIDVNVMAQLMSSLKPGSRLIMLGDPYQLPPVEAGALFSDIVRSPLSQKNSVLLKQCMRSELENIIQCSQEIKNGSGAQVKKLLSQASAGVQFVQIEKENDWKLTQQRLLEKALPLMPVIKDPLTQPLQLLQQFNRFRILAPLRKGPLGVEALNQFFFKTALAESTEDWIAVPIMIVKNDYRLELFNGEVGVLFRKLSNEVTHDDEFAFFPSKNCDNNSPRRFPAILLPKFEYAYCLSIYKSQGSEFDHVLLIMPEKMEHFGRELLYTAVTRARKHIEIWGHLTTIEKMVERCSQRLSSFT